MNKRIIFALAFVEVLAVGVFAQTQPLKEPSYDAVSLSSWIERLPEYPAIGNRTNEATVAIRSIGTNALPYLLKMLATDSTDTNNILPWRGRDGLICLEGKAEPAIPALIKLLQDRKHVIAVSDALRFLGRAGFQALTNGFTNTDSEVRFWSVSMLGFPEALEATNDAVLQFQRDAEVAVPALVAELRDPNPHIAHHAAFSLMCIHQELDIVIPALTRLMNDKNAGASPRKAARQALVRFGVLSGTTTSTNIVP